MMRKMVFGKYIHCIFFTKKLYLLKSKSYSQLKKKFRLRRFLAQNKSHFALQKYKKTEKYG